MNYAEGQGPPEGRSEFPFSIMLPEWLPDSMMLGEPLADILMRVEYNLIAQLIPTYEPQWVGANAAMGISISRKEKSLFVNRAPNAQIEVREDIEEELTAKVGGFLGMRKSTSYSDIMLEKDVFNIGETMRVKIRCDNRDCRNSVKGFKLKLLRNIQCETQSEDGAPKYANLQKYIMIEKFHEFVAPHQNLWVNMTLDIPL